MGVSRFILLSTLFNMAVYHLPFYKYAISHLDIYSSGGFLIFISLNICIFVVNFFIFFLIATFSIRAIKYFMALAMVSNSFALYFVLTYSVILDRTMMGNIFNTRVSEAMSFFSPKIFIYVVFLGLIPALVVLKVKLIREKRVHLLRNGFIILVAGISLLYLNSTTWLWLDKNSKIMGGLSMPWSYMFNPIRYKLGVLKKNKVHTLLPDGEFKNNKKMVVVLVIGESARKHNFSIYGYKKDTNPNLKKMNITIINNTLSASTYTTASINSMLSYDGSTSDDSEPLPSYLQREGVDVMWRSNNWGEPKLNVNSYQGSKELRKECTSSGCNFDEVLLTGLVNQIESSSNNRVFVILHTAGSHGPTYYKKYPKKFEKFKPTCKSVDLKECTTKELINAYDNTIFYTDYFLSETIKKLKKLADRPVLMLYISDHGESLGEYGFYLHGTPYTIAPNMQKEIPFILWRSEKFIEEHSSNRLKKLKSYSHKNIFHTILGAFDFNSTAYDKTLDIFNEGKI